MLRVIGVGKVREKYLIQGIDEYRKRLAGVAQVEVVEVPDEPLPEPWSEALAERAREAEGERIRKQIKPGSYVVALAIEGKQLKSEELAALLDRQMLSGYSDFTFIIGGASGLAAAVLKEADFRLSFGPLTFPHQLMRLMLVEQLYRAVKISRGEPYHH